MTEQELTTLIYHLDGVVDTLITIKRDLDKSSYDTKDQIAQSRVLELVHDVAYYAQKIEAQF